MLNCKPYRGGLSSACILCAYEP
uniref:Uncharacterized protein n=1 Tax=Triticum urartu TaxID=4572 RepID=A0A8R7PT05_TRIUA